MGGLQGLGGLEGLVGLEGVCGLAGVDRIEVISGSLGVFLLG